MNTLHPKTLLRRWLAAALLIGGFVPLLGQPDRLDSERLSPGDFPALDGWTIRDRNNNRNKLVVQDTGLNYQVNGGMWVSGGTRSVLLKGGAPGDATVNMNDYAELPLDPPAPGTSYFSVVFNIQSLGTAADPAQLFIRLLGWDAYFAVKLFENLVEVPGGTAQIIPHEVTTENPLPPIEQREALVGVNHLLVGKISTDNLGGIRRISLWLNPTAFDEDTPLLTVARDGTKNVANITKLEARSQKVPTIIDNLTFGASWSDVVPMIGEDPGNIVLTLPADDDTGTDGIQMTGGTLTVTVDGAPYVADTVLPIGTVVTYTAVPAPEYELTGWNGTTLTGDTIAIPVYAPTNISPRFETGEFRVTTSAANNMSFTVQVQSGTSFSNTTRTLFDAGETIRIRAGTTRSFRFDSWQGELAALNGTGTNGSTPTQVDLVVGTGAIWDDKVLEVAGQAYINVAQFVTSAAGSSINAAEVEFEGAQSGMPLTVPLAEFNRVLAEKAPAGLAGVLNFDNVGDTGPILLDVTPDLSTPALAAVIEYNEDQTVAVANVPNVDAFHLVIPGREAPVRIGRGPWAYVEAGGRTNLATIDGPGALSPAEALWVNGQAQFFMQAQTSTSRDHTSGVFGLGGFTSYDLTFDPADKVIMAGGVYLSTNNFQHYNPDDLERLWAQAIYSDGTGSPIQSSTQIEQNASGVSYDHFFGFSAPAGTYITNLRVWMQGGNNRAFTHMDDIAVVLEGTGDGSYAVATAVTPEGAGTVTPSAEGPYAEGSSVTLVAAANEGYRFLGWAHTADTTRMISDATSLDVLVRTSGDITAVFEMIPTTEEIAAIIGGEVTMGVESDLYESDWLGTIYATMDALPWIYVFGQGWIYFDASGWWYDLQMGWAYTDADLYPWTYYNDAPYADWLYFVPGGADPRQFYDYKTGLLVEVPLSGAQ